MSAVREFRREDIPEVASLWLRVFRRRSGDAEGLQRYFAEIFFDSPWRDEALPSLVYRQEGRGVVGFLGVIPRVMRCGGDSFKVAVATQLMVDDAMRSQYPAAKLMRGYFAGSQDLSWSDGANEASERLWYSCGGKAALLYGINWTHALRPAQYAGALLAGRRPWLRVALPLATLCRSADLVGSATGLLHGGPPDAPQGMVVDDAPSDDTLLWCVNKLSAERSLRPEYRAGSLSWLLRKAADKRNHGSFNKCVVREANGECAGWFLYYVKRGDVAQVLQYGARPGAIRKVLRQLFCRVWKQGAVAVTGQLDPCYAKDLEASRCRLGWAGYGVVMHARRPEILNAIHQGDAFLSRLEGEWWARFSDPEWSEAGHPLRPVEPPARVSADIPRLTAAH